MKKKYYLKSIIEKLRCDNGFSLDKEKKEMFGFFIKNKFAIEDLDENINIDSSIFSELDELEHASSNNQYKTGSYYTNKLLIKRIVDEVDFYKKKIIDPSAGTGNFLIYITIKYRDKLKRKSDFVSYISKYIHFNEIKRSSFGVYIKRLNLLSLKFYDEFLSEEEIDIISRNCTFDDFLLDFEVDKKFDIIVGNPPYLGVKSMGKSYLDKVKKKFGFTDDLYSLFIFRSLDFLKEGGFLSMVTSSTYLTISSKQKLRDKMVDCGVYKIIKNNKEHFKIKTQTSIFFLKNNLKKKRSIEIIKEDDNGFLKKEGSVETKKGIRFSCYQNDISEIFDSCYNLYNKYKSVVHTTKSFERFIETEGFNKLISENKYLPLGLISYIATGVDFKGKNKETIRSNNNKKYKSMTSELEIENSPSTYDFINGLDKKKYIPAIKGKEDIYVLWTKEHVDFLKSIKAPIRNIRLYGTHKKIYCKTSEYFFTEVDEGTLCINTAGACFIIPVIDISLDSLMKQLVNEDIKNYLKENINNSLCLTTNDLKYIPIKIK
tara:strand:+ start:2380 stop:4011 length:1632 start_codon:yes stop_codon:yes gene_type:complete